MKCSTRYCNTKKAKTEIETANSKQIFQLNSAKINNKADRIPVEKSVIYKVDITAKVYDFLKLNPIKLSVQYSVFSVRLVY